MLASRCSFWVKDSEEHLKNNTMPKQEVNIMAKNTLVKSIDHLTNLLTENPNGLEFFINLRYYARSSKFIYLSKTKTGKPRFIVENYIDGSSQSLSRTTLLTKSNIGKAIALSAFYLKG